MKRKMLSALLCVAMVASMVAGCGGKKEEAATDAPAASETAEATETAGSAGAGQSLKHH